MKFILRSFFILLFLAVICLRSQALNFTEGYEQSTKKPMVLLIYAEWANNYQTYINVHTALEKEYSDKFNFVKLNIAQPETAAFNEKFHIYPNLPYILIFRDGGRVSRYIQKNCAADYSCVKSKMETFLK